jgi:hypothetical protein
LFVDRAALGQGVGDLAEGGLDGLLVGRDAGVALRLGQLEVAAVGAGVEDRLADGRRELQVPDAPWNRAESARLVRPPDPVSSMLGKNAARAAPMLALAARSWSSASSTSGRAAARWS